MAAAGSETYVTSMSKPDIRIAEAADLFAVAALYPKAFPEEDLVPLIRDLWGRADVMSLVAELDGALVGHVAFTQCHVGAAEVALLGPLAIAPARQRQGIGGALVRDGLARLDGAAAAVVLGDPTYYGRFGFEAGHEIAPPHDLPAGWAAAWRAVSLKGPLPAGRLEVPPPWAPRALWSE